MALDLDTLLAPVSEEAPAGPDLTYDPVRAEIDQTFAEAFQTDTDTGARALRSDIDWRDVTRKIETLSQRSKDLWLAAYLCRAGALTGDLDTVVTGAKFMAGLCETYWDSVHPSLEEYGFQGRKGPCESLASKGDFYGPLQGVRVLEHPRLGIFTGVDFDRFREGGEKQDGYERFRAALNEAPEDTLTNAAVKLDLVAAAIRSVDQILMAKAEGDTGANFARTYEGLAALKRSLLAFSDTPASEEAVSVEQPAAESEDQPAAEDAGSVAPASGGAPRRSDRIESRADVLRALDAISDYYRRREPHSPVPLVIQRAREWIDLDFLGVLADIAPSSLDEARRVLLYKQPGQ